MCSSLDIDKYTSAGHAATATSAGYVATTGTFTGNAASAAYATLFIGCLYHCG